MITRLAAAGVGLAVILPAILWGGVLWVEVIVAVASLICLDEYRRMAFPRDAVVPSLWLAIGWGVAFAALVHGEGAVPSVAAALVLLGSFTVPLLRTQGDLAASRDAIGKYVVGIAWIALLGFIVRLRQLDHGVAWVFLVLAIPWAGDTGAYFAGRAFGRRKLYPLVSPKKTWEGFAGGIIVSVVAVFIVRALGLPNLRVLDSVGLGALLGAAAVAGDLSESLLKRAYDVKDSGAIMPGHGGLLDRVDSVLFVAPLLYAYTVAVGP